MKFFLDTANLEELKAGARWGIIDGVTTNPSLIAKEGVAMEDQIRKICAIIDGDISAEVVATDADAMLVEGRKLAKIHKNVVVKVPLTRDGIRACSIFHKEGIRVNVTLCFSAGRRFWRRKRARRISVLSSDGSTIPVGTEWIWSATSFTFTRITGIKRRCWRRRYAIRCT